MMNGSEEWRDIKGYEGIYQISDCGRVKSLERIVPWGKGIRHIKEKFLRVKKKKSGYLFYCLYSGNGTVKYEHAHRLVAQAFIPNPLQKKDVNHIDGNKSNNCVDNLEWATRSENQIHAYNVLKRTREHPIGWDNKLAKHIVQLNLDGTFVKKWASSCDFQRQTGKTEANVRRCLTGKMKTAYGFRWMYLEDYQKEVNKLLEEKHLTI